MTRYNKMFVALAYAIVVGVASQADYELPFEYADFEFVVLPLMIALNGLFVWWVPNK